MSSDLELRSNQYLSRSSDRSSETSEVNQLQLIRDETRKRNSGSMKQSGGLEAQQSQGKRRKKGIDLNKVLKNGWLWQIKDDEVERALNELTTVLESHQLGDTERLLIANAKDKLKKWAINRKIRKLVREAQKNGSYEFDQTLQFTTAEGDSEDLCENATESCDSYNVRNEVAAPKHFSIKYAEDFVKKLLDQDNNKVAASDFKGLEEKLKVLNITHLLPIHDKIRKLCGEVYDQCFMPMVKVLVWAAIKEMEDIEDVQQVDETKLLIWGAAFNRAEQAGYQMDFAKRRLELIARAYLGSHDHIKEKFNKIEKFVKAANDVEEMKGLMEGFFPSDD